MRFSFLFLPSLLGFISGLPLCLVGSTLQAWGASVNLNLMVLGWLTLIGAPYSYKFLWAPVLDKFPPVFWKDHRRGWILNLMLLLMIGIFFLSYTQPQQKLFPFIFCSFTVATIAATLDIAIDAFRTEFLPKTAYGTGNASFIAAYRISGLISGASTLILANYWGWRFAYQMMIVLMLFSFFVFLLTSKTSATSESRLKKSDALSEPVFKPFKALFQIPKIGWILLFIILYKLGEALASALMTPFLIKELHFSLTALASIYKTIALTASISGAFLGGLLYNRYSLYSCLMSFGILQGSGILLFAILAHVGHSYPWAITAIAGEAFTAGMATTVFLAFLMNLCNPNYTATHFALFSAFAAIGRIFTGPLASLLVQTYHWQIFFILCFFSCWPGLILLTRLKKNFLINFT